MFLFFPLKNMHPLKFSNKNILPQHQSKIVKLQSRENEYLWELIILLKKVSYVAFMNLIKKKGNGQIKLYY